MLMPTTDLPEPDDQGIIHGWRSDLKAKSGLESQPIKADTGDMRGYLSVIRDAKKLGAPMPSVQELTALRLMEGRDDFGFNYKQKGVPVSKSFGPQAKELASVLQGQPYYYSPEKSAFAGLMFSAQKKAERLGRPWTEVWNGLGTNKYGQSGAEYSDKFQRMLNEAVPHPSNQQLHDFIASIFPPDKPPEPAPTPTASPKPMPAMPNPATLVNTPFARGGVVMPDGYKPGGKVKLI
jgi:hypothetical protein